ncbi:hypothetical protein [Shinella sp.]|uniref:hypothetical protein n=1 Tax=Shinella sp. TaxID=1870904 RepID=UPI0028AA87A0|nr:hypothetical protein [Shinella sp.]
MSGKRDAHLPRLQGSFTPELSIHPSFAALKRQKNVYHAENNIEKPAYGIHAVYYCETERDQPQDKKHRGNFCAKQTEKQKSCYISSSSEISPKPVGKIATKLTPYLPLGTRLVFLANGLDLQALAFGCAQLLKQPVLQTLTHHPARAASNVNSPIEVAQLRSVLNPDAPSEIENPNHA